jgi:DNA processing protein
MKEQDLFYLLALQRIEAWAIWPNSRIVVQAAVLQRLQLAAIDGIGSVLLKKFRDKSVFEKATQELEFINRMKSMQVYFQDEDYRNG